MRKILIFLGIILVTLFAYQKNQLNIQANLDNIFLKKKIEEIKILNLNNLSKDYLINQIGISEGDSYWAFNPIKLKKKLVGIKEIKDFNFNLKPSGVLEIFINENNPFMIWNDNGKIKYIDENGNVLKIASFPSSNLITLYGENANLKIKDLNKVLKKYNSLKNQIREIAYSESVGWRIIFYDQKCIYLPLKKIDKVIEIFKVIKDSEIYKDFRNYDGRIIEIEKNEGRIYMNDEECLI
tara:strand:+ start:505 stop:1221 length:717 start_codon:yes stop_codon:yes gene_type:complete